MSQRGGNRRELCPAPVGTGGTGRAGTRPRLTPALRPAGEKLARPTRVRFDAEIAHHLLRWEPGHNHTSDVRYEVEHRV